VKLRQLEYFLMVADEGGFNRAAQRLHVAQPSLSVQIRSLEDEVGARLFERDKRHVFLTQAGKRFQQHARSILSLAETAKIEARCAEAGELGALDVSYSASAMFSNALPTAIRRFQKQFPYVVLTLHDSPSLEQLHGLLERTLDLGILRKPEVRIPAGIEINEWYRAPLVVAIQQDHHVSARGRHRTLLANPGHMRTRRISAARSTRGAGAVNYHWTGGRRRRRGDCSRRNSMHSAKRRHLQTPDGRQRLLGLVPRSTPGRS
jgi:DNA-binding transcriptional LysR family regulator